MKAKVYEYRIPVWAICPIVYGDYSSLENRDIDVLEAFLKEIPINGSFSWPEDIDESKGFYAKNDIDGYLGNDCIDVKYTVFEVVTNDL